MLYFENLYSVRGIALAFRELDENNMVSITKNVSGSGWDELRDLLMSVLQGIKCDFKLEDDEHNFRITPDLETFHSVREMAVVFRELDENNTISITKNDVSGVGWEALGDSVVTVLQDMKCDFELEDDEHNVRITIFE